MPTLGKWTMLSSEPSLDKLSKMESVSGFLGHKKCPNNVCCWGAFLVPTAKLMLCVVYG